MEENQKESINRFEQFRANYYQTDLQLTESTSFNISEIIEDNINQFNGQFEDPLYPDGMEKTHFKLGWRLFFAALRHTDIDTKNTFVESLNQPSTDLVPLVRGALKAYFKHNDYDSKINTLRQPLIWMGHLMSKEVRGESIEVNLQNIIRPHHIMDLQKSGLIEETFLTWDEMLENKKAWSDNWTAIEDLHAKMIKEQQVLFKVYEWWTWDDFGKKYTRGCIKYLDNEMMRPSKTQDAADWDPHVELERFASPHTRKVRSNSKLKRLRKAGLIAKGSDEEPIFPYVEERLIPINGRWLGLGFMELTRGMEEITNETMNTLRRNQQLRHKSIVVHKQSSEGEGTSLTQDFLSNIDMGAVLDIENDEELQRLVIESITQEVLLSVDKLFEIARQITGISAAGTGEEIPASTTATIGIVNQKEGKTTYDLINEQQSLFFKRIFEMFKMKQIIEDITAENCTKIMGDTQDLMDAEEVFIDYLAKNKIAKQIDTGVASSQIFKIMDLQQVPIDKAQDILLEQVKMAIQMERQKEGDSRFAQLGFKAMKKWLLDELDWLVEFHIGNESFDKQTEINNLVALYQSPLYEGSRAKLRERVMELMGLTGSRYDKTEEEKQAELRQAQNEAQVQAIAKPPQSGMAQQEAQNNSIIQ